MNLKMEFLQKMIEEVMQEKKILEFSADSEESRTAMQDFTQADKSVEELIERNKELEQENENLRQQIEQLKSESEKEQEQQDDTQQPDSQDGSVMKEDLFRIKKGRLKEIVIEEMKKAKDQGLI